MERRPGMPLPPEARPGRGPEDERPTEDLPTVEAPPADEAPAAETEPAADIEVPDLPTLESLAAVEEKERETVSREVEYVDAEGNRIGTARMELSTAQVTMEFKGKKDGKPVTGRKLESLVIVGEMDGETKEIDLLELANPHGIEVHVADEHLVNYNYRDREKRATCPPLDTPLDVGVLLHELGHGDQYRDDKIGKLTPLYSAETRFGGRGSRGADIGEIIRVVEGSVEAIPNLEKFVDRETLEQLKRLQERHRAQMDEVRMVDRKINELDEETDRLYRTFAAERIEEQLDADTFFERCVEADEDIEDHPDDEALAAERKNALIAELESAGFSFSQEDVAPNWDVSGNTTAEELPLLPKEALEHVRDISEIAQAATSRLSVLTSTRRHDGIGKMILSIELTNERLRGYRVDVVVDVPEREFDENDDELEEMESRVSALEEEANEHRRRANGTERSQLMVYEGSTLPDIVAVPTKIMERDATTRAMRWMRKVRDATGADLTKRHKVRPESMVVGPEMATRCDTSTDHGMAEPERDSDPVTSSYEDLRRALDTYGAGKDWKLRRPDADDAETLKRRGRKSGA